MSAKSSKVMTPEQRARYYGGLIREAQRSGRPLSEVEAAHGLTPGRISRWRYEQRVRKPQATKPKASPKPVPAPTPEAPQLLPVKVVGERAEPEPRAGRGGYEVVLCGGRTLRLPADFDGARVAALVAALEPAC